MRNLLGSTGHICIIYIVVACVVWLQALKLQHPAGHLQVLLRLDVGQACIQAVLIEESGSCK